MVTTMTTEPSLSRKQLGQLLRRMRQEAGKTHDDLKAIASRSKISAIESGKTRVRAATSTPSRRSTSSPPTRPTNSSR